MYRLFRQILYSNTHGIQRTISGIDKQHLQSGCYLYKNFIKTKATPLEKIALAWGPAMASSVDPYLLKKHHLDQTPYHLSFTRKRIVTHPFLKKVRLPLHRIISIKSNGFVELYIFSYPNCTIRRSATNSMY